MPLPEGADIGPLSLKPVWLLVNAFHLTREVSYGAMALLIWDMGLTFADEVGIPRPRFVFHRTDETFPIGQLNMVCKVEHYKCPVSRQSLCRAGNDLPWNLGYASGHVFVGEEPY